MTTRPAFANMGHIDLHWMTVSAACHVVGLFGSTDAGDGVPADCGPSGSDRAQRLCVPSGQGSGCQTAGSDPPAAVQDPHPGRDWSQGRRL